MHLFFSKHHRRALWAALLASLTLGVSSCRFSEGVDTLMAGASARQKSQQQAYAALQDGDYSAARELFEAAIAKKPKPQELAQLYNGLGTVYNQLDQVSEAITAYKASLKLDPESPQVWVNLGVVYRLDGTYDKALAAYEKALTLDPNLATAHSSIGSLYVLQAKPELAIEAFQKAIAIDENLAITHGNLALAYAMVGQFQDAETSLNRAIALGYENGNVVQERIQELKKLDQTEAQTS